MKQKIFMLISAIAVYLAFISGCKKNDQGLNNKMAETLIPITKQPVQNQIKFAEDKLKEIGTELGKLSKNKQFVAFVHNEVKKKFDGEYEVLIQDLLKSPEWKKQLNTPAINNALNAFKNIEGSSFYPHIYIPRFLKEEKTSVSARYDTDPVTTEVTFAFYGGETLDNAPLNDSYPGYIVNTNNELEYIGMVNETFANENEVWVLAINESVDDLGVLIWDDNGGGGGSVSETIEACTDLDCDLAEVATNTPIFDNSAGHSTVNFKITSMAVKDPKEGWISGGSEICIRAKLSCYNDRERGGLDPAKTVHYRSNQYSNYLGKFIRKFTRREVKNQDIAYFDYVLQTDWPNQDFQTDPIYFDYTIFERDRWPAAVKENTRYGRPNPFFPSEPNAESWSQKYRSDKNSNHISWQFPYVVGSFVNHLTLAWTSNAYYASGLVNNSEIAFTTAGY